MTLRVEVTPRAERDLLAIRAYIFERNPAAAERVRARIAQTIDLLTEFPNLGRATNRAGILMVLVPRYSYKIYYAITHDALQIVHVRHPAREDPQAGEL